MPRPAVVSSARSIPFRSNGEGDEAHRWKDLEPRTGPKTMTAFASTVGSRAPLTPALRLRGVQEALVRLSRANTLIDLVQNSPRELCEECGLERAMLSSLHDGRLAFASAAHPGNPERESRFRLL